MGLIAPIRRLHYVWSWRLRYWWLDTPAGERAHYWALGFSLVVFTVQVVRLCVAAALPGPHDAPVQSVIHWWVVQLIIAVVLTVVSYALRPKVEPPKPQDAQAPTVEDGQAVKHHFGTVWIGDEFVLAWKMMGRIPIKSGGGKK